MVVPLSPSMSNIGCTKCNPPFLVYHLVPTEDEVTTCTIGTAWHRVPWHEIPHPVFPDHPPSTLDMHPKVCTPHPTMHTTALFLKKTRFKYDMWIYTPSPLPFVMSPFINPSPPRLAGLSGTSNNLIYRTRTPPTFLPRLCVHQSSSHVYHAISSIEQPKLTWPIQRLHTRHRRHRMRRLARNTISRSCEQVRIGSSRMGSLRRGMSLKKGG